MSKVIFLIAFFAMNSTSFAQDESEEVSQAKFQATYIWQTKPSFNAAYSGTNSLSPTKEKSYSFTATAGLGFRPWQGGELYLNPEVSQGAPLSGLTGLGAFTDGEMTRASGSHPHVYRARFFLRQTWGLGGEKQPVESDMNQLAGMVDKRRFVITAGNFSPLDIFDDNSYAHDPRTDFVNWCLMTHCAFDYPADARGYSWGLVAEYYNDDWVLRMGRFLQPEQPNQLPLDYHFNKHYGDQIELENNYQWREQTGKLKFLVFRNKANMASYQEAIDFSKINGGIPDINNVRKERIKYGIGINVEHNLTPSIGMFGRLLWNNGATETYAFTEVHRSASLGTVIKGTAWKRSKDNIGIAIAQNTISSSYQNYLSQGGLGFFIGDGKLNYRPERLAEVYYNWNVMKGLWISLDYQYIANPAYNADRGQVSFFAMRVHTEF
jgi:hypothetical protein